MIRKTSVVFAAAFLVASAISVAAFSPDPNIGTWNLNVAKSKFSPGPAPKSQTLKIEAWGDDGVKYTSDGVDGDGKPTHTEFQGKYDGKFVAFKGNPEADMLAYARIDANHLDVLTQLKGKPTQMAGKIVVSADGKTRTLTQTGKNAKGEMVNNTIVYEKQ